MSVDYSAKLLVGYEVDYEYYNKNIDKEDGDGYLCRSNDYGTSQFFFGKTLNVVSEGEGCEVSTDLAQYTRICEEVMNAKARLDGNVDFMTMPYPKTYLICSIW